jgi:hypothetical protein
VFFAIEMMLKSAKLCFQQRSATNKPKEIITKEKEWTKVLGVIP